MEDTIKIQREACIRNAYFELLKSMRREDRKVSMKDIAAEMMNKEAPRFFTSLSTAQRIISKMYRGMEISFTNRNKKEMYEEIFRRVKKAVQRGELENYIDIEEIITQPAPSYYVNKITMRSIIYRAISKRRTKHVTL